MDEIAKKTDGTYKIAVAGTGYVDLVAGVCFAEVGHSVVCVDIDEDKIKLMKSAISPIHEAELEDIMRKNYEEGRLDYTTGLYVHVQQCQRDFYRRRYAGVA